MSIVTINAPPSLASLIDPEAQRRLISYLHLLAENLNVALNNIDDTNFTNDYKGKIDAVAEVTEKAKQFAELIGRDELAYTRTVNGMYSDLRDSFFASVDNVTASFNSLIEQTRNEITSYVEANFIASDSEMTLDEKISSMIQQTADQILITINTQASIVTELSEILAEFGTYFSFKENGLEIGKVGDGASPIIARLTNERLEFAIAGTDVVMAYISNNKLHINVAEIESLAIGDTNNGYVDFGMDPDGLALRWRSEV